MKARTVALSWNLDLGHLPASIAWGVLEQEWKGETKYGWSIYIVTGSSMRVYRRGFGSSILLGLLFHELPMIPIYYPAYHSSGFCGEPVPLSLPPLMETR
ncbi:hypothetical protein K440DRAFT_612117 [Wilcoxina mikolae CBS 423.85]|nr:hypothetical protein K440DRAFT_612117 [Wilcoxina mikolae CBS 423.85]